MSGANLCTMYVCIHTCTDKTCAITFWIAVDSIYGIMYVCMIMMLMMMRRRRRRWRMMMMMMMLKTSLHSDIFHHHRHHRHHDDAIVNQFTVHLIENYIHFNLDITLYISINITNITMCMRMWVDSVLFFFVVVIVVVSFKFFIIIIIIVRFKCQVYSCSMKTIIKTIYQKKKPYNPIQKTIDKTFPFFLV